MNTQHTHNAMNWGPWGVTIVVGLSAILVAGLIAMRAQPAAVSPARPIAFPPTAAVALTYPTTRNRIFQDEINATATLDLGDPMSPFIQWPERLSDVRPTTAAPITRLISPARPLTTNRIFLDEIAGVQSVSAGMYAPAPGEITPRVGPR